MLELIIMIAVMGLVVWAITSLVPMPPPFRNAIYVTSIVVLALYVLNAFGLWHGFHEIRLVK